MNGGVRFPPKYIMVPYNEMIELRFHPNEVSSLPPTVYIATGKETRGGVAYSVTTISFRYDNNYAIGCGGTFFPNSTHDNDIEYISLYHLDQEARYAYFSAHSRGQGVWVPIGDCEVNELGDLVVYVARKSHACYPRPGCYTRVFGLANDRCSRKGHTHRMAFQDLLPAYDFCYENGVTLYKGLRPAPPSESITPFQRFFLPFYVDRLRAGPILSQI